MKKLAVAFLAALLMCLPLCGTAGADEPQTDDATGWLYRQYGETVLICGVSSRDFFTLEIPSWVKGNRVVGIEEAAFQYSEHLTSVTIPASVTIIGDSAFSGCHKLKDIYYTGTSDAWNAIDIGDNAIPEGCTIHFLGHGVTVNLHDNEAGDRVVLGQGDTSQTADASGEYTIVGDSVTVTPGTGRRFTCSIRYENNGSAQQWSNSSEGAVSSDSEKTYTLDFSLGDPVVDVYFEDANTRTCRLFVKTQSVGANATGSWAVYRAGESGSYGDGSVLGVLTDGMASTGNFTFFYLPGTAADMLCVGTIYVGETLYRTIDSRTADYTFSAGDDVTINMIWYDRLDYSELVYDGNGSGIMVPPKIVARNSLTSVASPPVEVRTFFNPQTQTAGRWLFDGWNTDADGTGDAWQPGRTISINGDTILYAQWVPAWGLDLNRNGGKGSMDPMYVRQSEPSLTLPDCGFTRSGYVFAGWGTRKSGGTLYQPGDTLTLTADTTLYARWTEAWTVTFDPNGGMGGMDGLSVAKGQSAVLPDSAFARDGYAFDGWAAAAGGEAVYDPGDTVAPTADMTLYAVWKPVFGTPTLILPEGTTAIRAEAFAGDTAITVVDARSVRVIDEGAFRDCTGLRQIRLHADCAIDNSAFDGCTALEAIFAPAGGGTEDWAERHGIPFCAVE